MKVAMVVPGGVDRSGVQRVIPTLVALVERIASAHELHVFALHQEPTPCRYSLAGATIHCVGAGRGASLRAVGAMLREHRRGSFALVHAVFGGTAFPGALASGLIRRPLMAHLAGGELVWLPDIGYGAWGGRGSRGRLRWALSRAACLTTRSAAMAARAAELGWAARVVTYGIDLRRWDPVGPRRREPGAAARLVFVGSLNRVKDPETLLRAAAALRDRGVAFRLEIIGGDTLDGAVQRRADELRLDGLVRFRGFLTQAELRDRLLEADLLLVTSRHEAGPVVALEAAACGVPTVGSGVGYLRDWAPRRAVSVPPADPEALAEAVQALLQDEDRRLATARRAQEWTLAHDADDGARRVLRLYEEMTSGG